MRAFPLLRNQLSEDRSRLRARTQTRAALGCALLITTYAASSVAARPNGPGTLLWQQTLNGTANRWDWASSVAVDNQGNVVAAGVMDDRGTFGDFTVAKFDRDGTLLWQKSLNGTANATDDGGSVAVDGEGNVVAAGLLYNIGDIVDGSVAKFDRDGTLLWQQTLNGTANRVARVDSLVVDNKGNVVVAGFTKDTGTGANFTFTVATFDRDR